MVLKKVLPWLIVAAAAAFMACGEEEPAPVAETPDEAPEVVNAPIEEVEMTEEEKMAYVMENCICPQCPSWVPEASEKGEGGYCATGMSECIIDEAGCICADCPVTAEMGLEWGYYCTRGSAAEMMEPAATEEPAGE
jgi:hypothetical protein